MSSYNEMINIISKNDDLIITLSMRCVILNFDLYKTKNGKRELPVAEAIKLL